MARTFWALACFALVVVWSGVAAAQQEAPPGARVALVVGNGTYAEAPLKNPVNDARAISRTLGKLGFRVIARENASPEQMESALVEFGSALEDGGVGLFYFAGHGMQASGQNWLLPTRASYKSESDVVHQALSVDTVLATMGGKKLATRIVILDACRNSPFADATGSSARGLAFMNASANTLIAFATSPDSVADDGSRGHGIYTEALLAEMKTRGLPIEEVFRRVRTKVEEQTQRRQTPWESSSLTTPFSFNPDPAKKQEATLGERRIDCALMRKEYRTLMMQSMLAKAEQLQRQINRECR